MKSFKPLQCYSTFHPGITGYERGWGVYGRKDHLLLSLYALVLILKSNLQNFWRTYHQLHCVRNKWVSSAHLFKGYINLHNKHRGKILSPHMSWFCVNLSVQIFIRIISFFQAIRAWQHWEEEKFWNSSLIFFLSPTSWFNCYCNTLCRYFSNGCNSGRCFLKVIVSVLK